MFLTKTKLIIFCILFCSCGSGQDQKVPIRGRIALFDSRNNIIHLRNDSSWREIELNGDKRKSYSGLTLNNTTDNFLVIEYSQNKSGRTVEGDIIEFNISGDSINKVFDSKSSELVGNLCLSKNDTKLLFTLENDYFNSSDPLGQLNRPVNILIMDFKKREVIRKLDTVSMSLNVWINYAPWLSNESSFIYDFRTDRKIKMYNDTSEERMTEQSGIYLYDINLDKKSFLIPDGYSGVVSPLEDKIAYLKGKSIYVYDVNKKSNELLYSLSKNEKTAFVNWTPNGDYIYFESYSVNNFGSDGAFLIRLSDKRKLRTDWIKTFY
jgi:Tol biopolymer transport system component